LMCLFIGLRIMNCFIFLSMANSDHLCLNN
jgi:hypothetical protein